MNERILLQKNYRECKANIYKAIDEYIHANSDEMRRQLIDAGKKPEEADVVIRQFRTAAQIKMMKNFSSELKKVVSEQKKDQIQSNESKPSNEYTP